MVPMTTIEQWARGIGLATCVGVAFVNERGRLPQSIPELEQWGNATGRRNPATLEWTCRAEDATPRAGGVGAPPGPVVPGGADPFSGIGNWLTQGNNGLIALAAVGAILLLRQRR
jgi:hypothetical protein